MGEPIKTNFKYVPFEERPGGSSRPKPVKEETEEKPSTPKHCGDGFGLANMTAKQLNAWHEELRSKIPKLTFNEIRRHKLPIYVSMSFELEEEGLPKSAAYITELVQYNNEMREVAGPDSALWSKPRLMDNRPFLERLRQGLSKAEKSQIANNVRDECRSYLKLAVFFMNEKSCWWWIAEQLFMKTVECVVDCNEELKKFEAIVHYIFGMFLLRQLNDVDGALYELQLARELSEGTTWNATRELKLPQETVFVETCRHLYKALVLLAIRVRPTNALQAVHLCKEACKRAVDANMTEARAEALYQKGLSYEENDQPEKAIKCFLENLQLCKFLNDNSGICDSYLELATCHKTLDCKETTLSYLQKFLEFAEAQNLSHRLAEAHRYLGEFLMSIGNIEESREHFAFSFSLNFKLGLKREIEELRVLASIAEGLGLLPLYAQLVIDSEINGMPTVRLIRWKDIRLPFWGNAGCVSKMSIHSESSLDLLQSESSLDVQWVVNQDGDSAILEDNEEELEKIEPDE